MLNSTSETNFNQAWWKAIQNVLNQKNELHFGSHNEPKQAWDSTQLIELTGHAIKQVLNGEIHPQSTFRALDSYKKEFTYKYLDEYNNKPTKEQFDYLYMDRLAQNQVISCSEFMDDDEPDVINQLECMKNAIYGQKERLISSNYTLATTWYADQDGLETPSSPCLQIIQLRWNPGDLIDMHLIWRSRDLYNAWQANIVAISDMVNRECILPNDCKLARITDYSTSLHIYKGDIEQAKRVVPVYLPRP